MTQKPLIDFTKPEMALISGTAPAENRNALKKTTTLQKFAQGVFLSLALLTALGPSAQAFAQPYAPQQLTYIKADATQTPNKVAGYELDYPAGVVDIVEATTTAQFNKAFHNPIEQDIVRSSAKDPISLTDLAGNRSVYDFNYLNATKKIETLNNKELINHTGEIVAVARHFIQKGETGENASKNLIEICKYATPAIQELQSRQELSNLTGTQQVFETCSSEQMQSATRSQNLTSMVAIAGQALLSGVLKALTVALPVGAALMVVGNVRKARAKKEEEAIVAQNTTVAPSSPPTP